MNNKEVNLLDILIILARWKKQFLWIVGSITIAALIISLIWPKSYKASAQFIYNKPSSGGSVSGILNSFLPMSGSSSQLGPEQALIILKSRELKDFLIEKFDLGAYYEKDLKEELYQNIESNIIVEETREGGFGFNPIISISFGYTDESPEKTYDIVQSVLGYVDSTIVSLNKAANNKSFSLIEDQYLKNQKELTDAEDALNEFQNKYGVVEVEQQAEQLIMMVAELKAQSIELGIKIDHVTSISAQKEASSQLQQLKSQKNAVDQKYKELVQKADRSILETTPDDLTYSLLEYPDLLLRYGRLYREVKVQSTVYEYIYPLYIQSQTQLNDSYSGIQVIDSPRVPTYKDSPKRAIIVIAGFLFSLIVAAFYVGFKHLMQNNSKQASKIKHLKSELWN